MALKGQQDCCSFMYMYLYIYNVILFVSWKLCYHDFLQMNSNSCLDNKQTIFENNALFLSYLSFNKCLYKIASLQPIMSGCLWKTWWKLWSFFKFNACMQMCIIYWFSEDYEPSRCASISSKQIPFSVSHISWDLIILNPYCR